MFANSQMMGVDMCPVMVHLMPTPAGPVPVPSPNVAMGPMGVPAAYNILFMCMPAHNLLTTVPLSVGLPLPGVASGVGMGPSRPLTGAFTVLLDGMPATRLTSMNIQNLTNGPGMRIAPSQVKVLILSP